MAKRQTFARTLHDLGLGIWLGGTLMGAVGLNAAAAEAEEPTTRLRVANAGWARWTPVNLVGIGAFLAGATAIMAGNKGRFVAQHGVARASVAKTALTGLALAATAYSRVLGQKLMEEEKVPVHDGTTPTSETPERVAGIQKQLKVLQYAIPAHVAGIIAISAQMGEQQRPMQVVRGLGQRLLRRAA